MSEATNQTHEYQDAVQETILLLQQIWYSFFQLTRMIMMKKENGNYQQGLDDNCHCRSHQPISIDEKLLSKYLPNHQSFRTVKQFRNEKFSYRWNE
jgi:hypothetical protein